MAIHQSHFTAVSRIPVGAGRWEVFATYTPGQAGAAGGTHSYADGGEVLTDALVLAAFGVRRILHALVQNLNDPTTNPATSTALIFDHNTSGTTQGKLRAFNYTRAHTHPTLDTVPQLAGTECAVTTNLASVAYRCRLRLLCS